MSGLTLDNKGVMAAEFLAGPDAGSAIRLHWADDAVELRVDEDGPSVHAVRQKNVAFHEPPVENPRSTVLCKDRDREFVMCPMNTENSVNLHRGLALGCDVPSTRSGRNEISG